MKSVLLTALAVSAFFVTDAEARLVRILHTNDLHSYFDHGRDPAKGGYAALKAKMDELRAESEAQGIEVVSVDAGDFLEGSPYYFAGRGEESWRLMNAMNYDAVVIGNHDWLMGPADLDRLVGAVPPTFGFVGANFIFDSAKKNLNRYMKPYVELNKNGLKVAVLGLTTNEIFYDWRVDEGFINHPAREADQHLPGLRARNDLVIGLTHLGLMADKALVMDSNGFDIIVGGHSHTKLDLPVVVRDRALNYVPIVQTGEHGEYLGDVLLDLQPGLPARMLSYNLHPVRAAEAIDAEVKRLIENARRRLESDYDPAWLYEVIGQSEVSMDIPSREDGSQTIWGEIMGNAMREAIGAEIAVNSPEFFGVEQPAGPVTREKILAYYPRMFEFNHKEGWSVWEVRIAGWVLKRLLTALPAMHFYPQFTGVTFDRVPNNKGAFEYQNIKVNGRKLQPFRSYRVAVPEGLGRGVVGVSSAMKLFFKDPKKTSAGMWSAIEKKCREIGTVRAPRPR